MKLPFVKIGCSIKNVLTWKVLNYFFSKDIEARFSSCVLTTYCNTLNTKADMRLNFQLSRTIKIFMLKFRFIVKRNKSKIFLTNIPPSEPTSKKTDSVVILTRALSGKNSCGKYPPASADREILWDS